MSDQPRYQITVRHLTSDRRIDIETDERRNVHSFAFPDTVVQLSELVDGEYQPMKGNHLMASDRALRDAINGLDDTGWYALRSACVKQRDQATADGTPVGNRRVRTGTQTKRGLAGCTGRVSSRQPAAG